jgi:hypothetical protein
VCGSRPGNGTATQRARNETNAATRPEPLGNRPGPDRDRPYLRGRVCGESAGDAGTAGGQQTPLIIDEEAGSYQGVRLGGTAADVEEALGSGAPITLSTPAVSLSVETWEHQGPVVISAPIPEEDSDISGFRYPR